MRAKVRTVGNVKAVRAIGRSIRWVVLAVAIPLIAACVSRGFEPPPSSIDQNHVDKFVESPSLKLDILFMIDNSNSMKDSQANLIKNFPRFMQVLSGADHGGGKLDAHVAVISSDLGVATPGAGSCSTGGGDNGRFQAAPRGACAGPRGNFLITGPAGNNFDGSMEDAFSCIAALGVDGCGFEHQLASIRRALGGDPAFSMPPENAGFLRSDARLGIVIVTDEDDCSAPMGSDLFRADGQTLSDPLGPLDSFRCNEFGHLCGGQPPPRAAAQGLADCHSNETASSRLIHVSEFVAFLRGLKSEPDMLRVALITGPPGPYSTQAVVSNGRDFVRVAHSCSIQDVGVADPAVRLYDFVSAFGPAGLVETICTDDFGPAMQHIAEALVDPRIGCVGAKLVDRDLSTPGLQPECAVTQTHTGEDGARFETAVPACPTADGTFPCWRLAPDPRCASTPGNLAVSIDRGGAGASPNTPTAWSCHACPVGATLPGCAVP